MKRALAFVIGQLLALAITIGPMLGLPWWRGPRAYFSLDQLSYAGIAHNVAGGNVALVEPFTQTGNLFYPSLWYQLIGAVAFATKAPVWVVQQVLGVVVIGICVGVVGWVALRLSGRWWAPIMPAALLFTGTLSTITAGYWYTSLTAHAVVWGPFGTLFALNAEAIGIGVAAVVLALLLLARHQPQRTWLPVVIAALGGVLANVQTYSFFTITALLAATLAVQALATAPSGRRVVTTVIATGAVIAAGPLLAVAIGPLSMFALLIAAVLLPSTWPWIRQAPVRALTLVAAFALAAAPQVVRTLLGLLAADPFLTYRQASTFKLDVPIGTALVAALPLIALGVAAAIGLRGSARRPERAVLIALALVTPTLVLNDRWGFNQEPYRFWIQGAMITALLLGVLLPTVMLTSRTNRAAFIVALAAAIVLFVVSLSDVIGFARYAREQGVIDLNDARAQAISAATANIDGLIAAGPCIDPQHLNLLTPAPVAYYNLGLAWPDNPTALDTLKDPGRRDTADAPALRAANVQWVILDSACEAQWEFGTADQVAPVLAIPYATDAGEQQISLLRVL